MNAPAAVLSRAAIQRMEETLPWYVALPAQERSWVGLVAQAGVRSFLAWLEDPSTSPTVTTDVFGAAPRELTRSVSLRQTLDLVRAVVTVIEDNAATLAEDPDDAAQVAVVSEAVLRYSREVAFSAAEVYAQAAELRGSWDTRLEALVVDALLRGDPDDALRSRLAALGWRAHPSLAVVVGMSTALTSAHASADALRVAAQSAADDALVGLHGESLVAVFGTAHSPWTVATSLSVYFGAGPVVVGPTVNELDHIALSARAALSGLAAAAGWPDAPRPVHADDLLPERVLRGDADARSHLVDQVYGSLIDAGPALVETVSAYLDNGRSLEATARALFVHPNTVRYRLRRVAELSGWDAVRHRDALVLQVSLILGRLQQPATPASL